MSQSSTTTTIRAAFHGIIDDLERIDALICTTFQLAVPFFEDNILGPLANETFKLSTLHEIHSASQFASDSKLAVFYDGHATTALDKRATFDTFPIFINNGAFHPKIAIVFGRFDRRPVVRLMVSSANLTLSGWAKNREIVVTTDVDHPSVSEPLIELINWLCTSQGGREPELVDRYADLLTHLQSIEADSTSVMARRLFVSIPAETDSLMSALAESESETLLVAAPYFSPHAHTYFRNNLGNIELRLSPALSDDHRLPLLDSDVELFWRDKNAQLGTLELFDGDAERFDHFKLFAHDDEIIVGSHNATRAALGDADGTGHQNVEVSLSVPGDPTLLGYTPFTEMPAGQPTEQDLLDDQPTRHLPCRIDVTADWRRRVYRIEAGRALPGLELRLPGIETRISVKEIAEIPFTLRTDVELLDRRWFEVFCLRSGEARRIYRGYINEIYWRGYRREAVMQSLTACLDAWVDGTAGNDDIIAELARPVSERLRCDGEERLEPALLEARSDDVFENYFRLFRATRLFWENFEATIDAATGPDLEGAARLLHSAPGSLQRVVELVEERIGTEDDPWSVYRFILIHEVARLVHSARKKLQIYDATELLESLEELAARSITLRETFLAHPAWSQVMEEGKSNIINYVLEELGYAASPQ